MTTIPSRSDLHLFTGAAVLALTLILSACGGGRGAAPTPTPPPPPLAVRFFGASDGINGFELWKSNGTEMGTELVKDINPAGNSTPNGLTVFNNALYFEANDGTNGRELWKSNGTEVGTVLFQDICPGPCSGTDF